MASENLPGIKVAILVENGFEQVEMPSRASWSRPATIHVARDGWAARPRLGIVEIRKNYVTVFTIGVYGSERDTFFDTLEGARIDTLLDVRRRRAARGTRYAFANRKRLTSELARRGITYRHVLGLAPDNSTRAIQYEVDARERRPQSERIVLAPAYVEQYVTRTLDRFDFTPLVDDLRGARAPVLFCLERIPDACHRSLVAPRLARALGAEEIVHLIAQSASSS